MSWNVAPRRPLSNYNHNSKESYANYPVGVVTHTKEEPVIHCHGCQKAFSTDPRQRDERGFMCYIPVTRDIVYCRRNDVYLCTAKCYK